MGSSSGSGRTLHRTGAEEKREDNKSGHSRHEAQRKSRKEEEGNRELEERTEDQVEESTVRV